MLDPDELKLNSTAKTVNQVAVPLSFAYCARKINIIMPYRSAIGEDAAVLIHVTQRTTRRGLTPKKPPSHTCMPCQNISVMDPKAEKSTIMPHSTYPRWPRRIMR